LVPTLLHLPDGRRPKPRRGCERALADARILSRLLQRAHDSVDLVTGPCSTVALDPGTGRALARHAASVASAPYPPITIPHASPRRARPPATCAEAVHEGSFDRRAQAPDMPRRGSSR